ncbi:MAG: ISAzo13 family transposase [Gammaproteobacteria bacterium]
MPPTTAGEIVKGVRRKFEALRSGMNEAMCRRWAATEAKAIGHGGITLVSQATGLSISRIRRGIDDMEHGEVVSTDRVRRPGAGRPKLTATSPALLAELEVLVDPQTRGDPISPLRWTNKGTRQLAQELGRRGYEVSPRTVAGLLQRDLGYNLQVTQKTREGADHPDRNAQFEYINRRVRECQRRNQPVISVDTKKKELVGDFANAGREWQPKGTAEKVRTHDFPDKNLGKVAPYGVYDIAKNQGWVSVGTDHDTPAFAVATIRQWWRQMGRPLYPKAGQLLVTADCGGSNGHRPRLWKLELQRLADEIDLQITVCHFPPGTSKWNKIEHRMFCHITRNWRGRPLESQETIINLIANTTTDRGLKIRARLDRRSYPKGIVVTDAQLASLRIKRATFHGDWNYTISPRRPTKNER